MWFVQAPVPDPTPTVYMYLDQVSSGGGGLPPWVTTIAPFVASTLALVGVIWSSLYAARTVLRAEDRRARAAIEAEDARAKAAIEAEDRRHDHQVSHDDQRWRRDTRADAYFKVIEAATGAVEAASELRWFARNVAASGQPYRAANPSGVDQMIEDWNSAVAQASLLNSTIRAIGNPAIADLSSTVRRLSGEALEAITDAADAAKAGTRTYNEVTVAKKHMRKCFAARRELVAAVREELGAEPIPLSGARGQGAEDAPDESETRDEN